MDLCLNIIRPESIHFFSGFHSRNAVLGRELAIAFGGAHGDVNNISTKACLPNNILHVEINSG